MPLTQTQLNTLNTYFRSKGINLRCPICSTNQFSTGDISVSPSLVGGNINLGGPAIPMIPMICNNCGHIIQFAAIQILGPNL